VISEGTSILFSAYWQDIL